MRSQTEVSSVRIVERVRTLGHLTAPNSAHMETELARQLDMSEHSPAELYEALEHGVSTGKLKKFDHSIDLGKGGVTEESVTEDVTIYTVAS